MIRVVYYALIMFVFLIKTENSHAVEIISLQQMPDLTLSKRDGFLLVDLEVDGVAPSLEFALINTKVKTTKRRYALKLKNLDKGIYFAHLPEGRYQVTNINAPYYNFPFKLDTSDDELWQFEIKKQHVNYIGNLMIKKERSEKSIFVKLANRMAMLQESALSQFDDLFKRFPLRSGTAAQDNFYQRFIEN